MISEGNDEKKTSETKIILNSIISHLTLYLQDLFLIFFHLLLCSFPLTSSRYRSFSLTLLFCLYIFPGTKYYDGGIDPYSWLYGILSEWNVIFAKLIITIIFIFIIWFMILLNMIQMIIFRKMPLIHNQTA